jgi:hypothetical protein
VELKRLGAHVKVDNDMQNMLLKSDYNDDELLPSIISSLQNLKISLESGGAAGK